MNTVQADDIRFFDLTSRIGRLRYLAYGVALLLLAAAALLVCAFVTGASTALGFALFGIVYIAALVMNIGFGVRRLHDMDRSGWWMLLMLIPLVNLIMALFLIFAPGSDGENRFGEPPPPNSTWVVVGAISYIFLIPIGILAAIAIPAYQDYIARSQTTEGVQLAGGAEVGAIDYFQKNKAWPADLSTVYDTAKNNPAGRYVATVTGAGNGDTYGITSTMATIGVNRMIAGKSLEIWTTDGGVTWHCGPGSTDPVDAKFLPRVCRETDAP